MIGDGSIHPPDLLVAFPSGFRRRAMTGSGLTQRDVLDHSIVYILNRVKIKFGHLASLLQRVRCKLKQRVVGTNHSCMKSMDNVILPLDSMIKTALHRSEQVVGRNLEVMYYIGKCYTEMLMPIAKKKGISRLASIGPPEPVEEVFRQMFNVINMYRLLL